MGFNSAFKGLIFQQF